MRTHVARDRSNRRSWLELRPGPHEVPDVQRIALVADVRHRALLVPDVSCRDDGTYAVRYEVTDMMPLRRFVRKDAVSHQQYERMLASVAEAAGVCDTIGMGCEGLLLDAGDVFATLDGVLHFALVPLVGGAPASRWTLLGLVGYLASARGLRFTLEDDVAISRDLEDWHASRETFDLEEYCDFLGAEFGVVTRTLRRPRIVTLGQSVCHEGTAGWAANSASSASWPNGSGVAPTGAEAATAESMRAVPARAASVRQASLRGDAPQGPGGVAASDEVGEEEPELYDIPDERAGEEPGGNPGTGVAAADDADDEGDNEKFELVREATGWTYPLAADEPLTLGRSPSCSVQILGNPDISRRQATVVCEKDSCVVCDLGSANGTTVRGHELGPNESARLSMGERFELAGEGFHIRRLR